MARSNTSTIALIKLIISGANNYLHIILLTYLYLNIYFIYLFIYIRALIEGE